MQTYEFTLEKLAFLKTFLVYDPETGEFRRTDGKNRNRSLKNPEATAKTYKQINVQGTIYYAHILAYWFMTESPVPEGLEIDHWDRNKRNCCWKNLRLVTSGRNTNNSSLRNSNNSGIHGVVWSERQQEWVVTIRVDGLSINLGRFDSFNDAFNARLAGEQLHLGEIVSRHAVGGLPDPDPNYQKLWDYPPTGVPGVYNVRQGRFTSRYRNKTLGTFESLEEAVAARNAAMES